MKRKVYDLRARDFVLKLGHATKIMGVVNCSPDSFSGDGKRSSAACLSHARKQIQEGADILDIGGESTRPGALMVPPGEEIRRVIPVIKSLARHCKIPISVDTYKVEVARVALDAGASIVNDIKGARAGRDLLKMVRDYSAAIIIMHMRGTPITMQSKTRYKDVVKEVI